MQKQNEKTIKLQKREYKYYTKGEKSLRTDGVFQTVLGSPVTTDILKDLLESILHTKIEELEVSTEKSTMITNVNNMRMRFDLYVVYDKNNQLDIEMQNNNCYNIIQRLETNASALYHDAHKKLKKHESYRDRYSKEIKTKAIAFLDYNEFKDGPYHEVARVTRNSNGESISDDIEYHFIQMPKFFEQVKEIKNKEEAWIAYLSNQLNSIEMWEVFEMDEKIRDVHKLALQVIEDDELMNAISKELVDRANDYTARRGMYLHGIKETQQKTAKKMLEEGCEIDFVAKITNLSKEEIEDLKNRII